MIEPPLIEISKCTGEKRLLLGAFCKARMKALEPMRIEGEEEMWEDRYYWFRRPQPGEKAKVDAGGNLCISCGSRLAENDGRCEECDWNYRKGEEELS